MKLDDLTGKKFGRLLVLKRGENKYTSGGNSVVTWDCICDCGNEKNVRGSDLKNKLVQSCGCLFIESISKTTHQKYNTYDLSGDYGIGYTTKGEEFYFDLEDYDLIKDYCWRVKSDGYIVSSIYINQNYKKQIFMHRIIMGCNDELLIDHINHIKKDNRKINLRKVTDQQNNMNNYIRKDNNSGVTGVFFDKKRFLWVAQIRFNKKAIYLGSYVNFNDAVKAREQAEEKYFCEYSYKNSINKSEVM